MMAKKKVTIVEKEQPIDWHEEAEKHILDSTGQQTVLKGLLQMTRQMHSAHEFVNLVAEAMRKAAATVDEYNKKVEKAELEPEEPEV